MVEETPMVAVEAKDIKAVVEATRVVKVTSKAVVVVNGKMAS